MCPCTVVVRGGYEIVRLSRYFDVRSETFSPEAVVTNTGVFQDMMKATVSDLPQIGENIASSVAPTGENTVFSTPDTARASIPYTKTTRKRLRIVYPWYQRKSIVIASEESG